jgi:hypothetical protein
MLSQGYQDGLRDGWSDQARRAETEHRAHERFLRPGSTALATTRAPHPTSLFDPYPPAVQRRHRLEPSSPTLRSTSTTTGRKAH